MQEREIALFVLIDIFAEGAYNNIILKKTFKEHSELSSQQRAFITELVNGTLRSLKELDYIIGQFSKTPVKKLKPFILNNLRLGIYQLMYMDKVPQSAVCNEAVKLAKKRGFGTLSGFVNGVLRAVARGKSDITYPDEATNPVEYLCVKYSYEEWMIKYWLEHLSYDRVKAMCEANTRPPHISICVNTTKITKSELARVLTTEGMSVDCDTLLDNSLYISRTGDLSLSPAFNEGLFHIMDESSMLAAKLLKAKPEDTVIDVCAAPGGKSFAIAESMGNKGAVYSRDCYEHKVSLITDGASRLGLDIIRAELKDATTADNGLEADCVVVDAPCSGLGLVRKKPDIKYTKTREDITELVKLQQEILKASASLVKQGGKLLYSTCTVSREENIEAIRYITQELDLEPIELELPDNISYATAKDGYIEILPSDYGTDGFFISLFRRK